MLEANYTNPQGDSFSKAVIRITSASRDKQFNQSARLREDGSGHDYNENSNDTFNFTAEYWPSYSRFDSGSKSYKFMGTAGQENFNFQMTPELEEVYDQAINDGLAKELGLEAVAEQYMMDNLLTGAKPLVVPTVI